MNKKSEQSQRQVTMNIMWLAPVAVIVLCALSFWGGTAYSKLHARMTMDGAAGRFSMGQGGFDGRSSGQRPNIGDVTAVSSSSITIKDNFDNSTKTFSIISSTSVTNNGASAAVSDIQTGERVLVRTGGSGSTAATAIDINPSFGGGQQGSSSSTGTSSVTN